MRRALVAALVLLAARAGATDVYSAGDTVHCDITTLAGVASALSSGAVTIYKDGGTTKSTTGVTLTVSRDTNTGYNHVAVDTSADGTFYATGHYFDAMFSGGTVGGASVVGYEICSWRLGVVPANVTQFGGTAGTFSAGYPDVNNVIGNVSGSVGSVSSGVSLSSPDSSVLLSTTASNQVSNVIRLASGSTAAAVYVGSIVHVTGGSNAGATRVITAYSGATRDATLDQDLTIANNTGISVVRGRYPAQSAGYVLLSGTVDANLTEINGAPADGSNPIYANVIQWSGASVNGASAGLIPVDVQAIAGGSQSGSYDLAGSLGYPSTTTIAAELEALPSASTIANATWNATLSSYPTAGTTGKKLGDIPISSSSLTAADVWNYQAALATTAGSIGALAVAKFSLIGTVGFAIQSPVGANGDLSLVPGVSYVSTPHSLPLIINVGSNPDVTNATPHLVIYNAAVPNAVVIRKDGTVLSSGGSTQSVQFELTAAETATLSGSSTYLHQVSFTWAADSPLQPWVALSGRVKTDKPYQH